MGIDFHSPDERCTYATRQASNTWMQALEKLVPMKNIHAAADVGCGGGIYSRALSEMGISRVVGIDFSKQMLGGARDNCRNQTNITFKLGNARDTNLPDSNYDLVLERALIHHLDDLLGCFREAYRILKPGGCLIVQDRTPEDCFLAGSPHHIRGYFFERFPELKQLEADRRHTFETVCNRLKEASLSHLESVTLWETRKAYSDREMLLADLRARTGRSILYELTDEQLAALTQYIEEILPAYQQIEEQDRWTIWKAVK